MLPRNASVLPFDSSTNMLLMNRLFSAAPMVLTCDEFYGLKTQPRALYSRPPVNVKVGQRGDQGRKRTILKLCPMTPRRYRNNRGRPRFCEPPNPKLAEFSVPHCGPFPA